MPELPKKPQQEPIKVKATKSKSTLTPLLLLGVFVLPVLSAYLLLKTGVWQQAGSTENGILLSPVVATNYHELLRTPETSAKNKGWLVVSIVSERCDTACQNSLMLARQSIPLLGPERHRATQLVLQTANPDESFSKLLSTTFPDVKTALITTTDAETGKTIKNITIDQLLQATGLKTLTELSSALIVVDPMSNAMMAFIVTDQQREAILSGKGFVKDLKKLLKMSRIG